MNNKVLFSIIAVAFVGGMFTVAYAGPIMPKITLAGNVDVTGDLDVNGPITSPTITDLENQISHTSLPNQVIVSIQESGFSGCEENNSCVVPFEVRVAVGGEVIWNNDSPVSHFLSSGTPSSGPSGEFDSGIIASGNSFAHTFNQAGTFQYFDLVHPWTTGLVFVGDLHTSGVECDNCILGYYRLVSGAESDGGSEHRVVACDPEDRITGGGYFAGGASRPVQFSYPSSDIQWTVFWTDTFNGESYAVWGVCVDYPPVHVP